MLQISQTTSLKVEAVILQTKVGSIITLDNRPIYQLCRKMGHTTVIYHHRYDKAENNLPTMSYQGGNQSQLT